MKLILADDIYRDHLLPFTFTRPIAELRIGILTIRQKWERILSVDPDQTRFITDHFLQVKFPAPVQDSQEVLVVNGALLPENEIIAAIQKLESGECLTWNDRVLAARVQISQLVNIERFKTPDGCKELVYRGEVFLVNRIHDLFRMNDWALRADFDLITQGRKSAVISSSNQVRNASMIFLEEGAVVENSIINASTGPVYVAAGAEIMEGCIIRGPFSLGEQAVLKMGAKVYGATTLGPGCKAGGELSNSVMMANSNKAHDGFLGNSVLGEWCNLGADTNNSNLKNNYGEVKLWNYVLNDFENTGLQFCGLFMGDHSKCAINTSFNTGTVTGVGANIFMHGFPLKFIPSFSWGGEEESGRYLLDKFLSLAETVMKRRNVLLSEADRSILSHLYLLQLHPHAED
jgi:UDP-N-acetylglucosamine diphosphorylase/glucosamine-1-phosphate N-acetyltransferase